MSAVSLGDDYACDKVSRNEIKTSCKHASDLRQSRQSYKTNLWLRRMLLTSAVVQ